MAGIGQACAHKSLGQTSCISGGRIDASCCVDSHFHTACHFKPGLMTGVICCRLPGIKILFYDSRCSFICLSDKNSKMLNKGTSKVFLEQWPTLYQVLCICMLFVIACQQ